MKCVAIATGILLAATLQGCSGELDAKTSATTTPKPSKPSKPTSPTKPPHEPTPAPKDSYSPALPVMPVEYSLKVTYSITTAGKRADYLTSRFYNLNGTSKHEFQYREDDWISGVLAASTIELPNSKKAAYRYTAESKECVSWDFIAAIDGFPLLYREPPYIMTFEKNETVSSVECNVFEFVFKQWWNQATQKYGERTYTVWFKKDSNQPVQIYDSMADVDGHIYTVSDFQLKVDDESTFDVPEEWNCKDPKAEAVLV